MKNILVIDDNHAIRDSVSSYLQATRGDYAVLTAADGTKGIDMMDTHPVSLILTDIEMPETDGYQVVDYAKRNYPAVPVIVMTGSWSFDLRALVWRTGVVHCLEKPFRFEDLSAMVDEALGDKSSMPAT
jgi:two-component system response regulator AtoC